jgi:hypothetical protein
MNSIQTMYESLLRGKTVPMPGGKHARPTGKPRTCSICSGSKTVVEEMPAACRWAYEESACGACWGTGKVIDFVIEDDPMMLMPWSGLKAMRKAERRTVSGERVAIVENHRGEIAVTMEWRGGSTTIAMSIAARHGGHELELWTSALRLADTELRMVGYRGI